MYDNSACSYMIDALKPRIHLPFCEGRARSGVFIAVFPTSPRTDLAFAPPQEFPRPIVDPGHAEGTIVDDHVLNYPSSDLMDALTGKKSFSGSLTVSVRQTVTGRRSSPATFSTGRPVTVFPLMRKVFGTA